MINKIGFSSQTLKRRSVASVSQGNERDMRQHRRGSGTFGSSLWLAAAAAIACFAAMAALRIMELNPVLPMGLGGDTGRPWRSSASFGTVNKKITQTSHKSTKKDFNVATGVDYAFASFSSWSKSTCYPN